MLYRNGYCAKGHDVSLPDAKTGDGHCRICRQGYDRNKYLVGKAKRAAARLAASQEDKNATAEV